jgi:CRISPR-associated Cas5-like protein
MEIPSMYHESQNYGGAQETFQVTTTYPFISLVTLVGIAIALYMAPPFKNDQLGSTPRCDKSKTKS